MPAVTPNILTSALLDAIQQSGGTAIYMSGVGSAHPRKFLVEYLDQSFSLWIYIWTLSPGGRPTLPNEYRIQLTSVKPPLPVNPDGYTVLLGYYADLGVFAGFDLQRHRSFSLKSPSVQISMDTILNALQNGLGFGKKTNEEITVGIRPDQMLNYVLSAEDLHKYGTGVQTFGLLQKASQAHEIDQQDITGLTAERKQIVSTVVSYSRAASFQQQVLAAYDHRCAVTRAQLKLVDAAHIVPVPSPDSSDHVTNGLALSPTMHRALDHCLIYLDTEYNMRLNDEKVYDLSKAGLVAGLPQFKAFLSTTIHLPADKNQWPNIKFIKQGNALRRIPGYY